MEEALFEGRMHQRITEARILFTTLGHEVSFSLFSLRNIFSPDFHSRNQCPMDYFIRRQWNTVFSTTTLDLTTTEYSVWTSRVSFISFSRSYRLRC
jgi:hypothetical protein